MATLASMQPLNKQVDTTIDSFYSQIVGQIRQWIKDGRLKDGDRLPSERELAKMFDISRVPVREALKVLEYLGAVKHIRGKGVYVKKIDLCEVLDSIDFLMVDPMHVLTDLFEAREAIEVQAARLAAERRTDDDLYAMESEIIEMERNIAMGKEVIEISMKFHSTIIAASHNSIIIRINRLLADLLNFSRQQSLKDSGRHEVALVFHRQIMRKIKDKDAEGAAKIMKEHLLLAKNIVMKMLEEKNR